MKANIRQVKGLTFVGKSSSNHWLVIDGPIEFAGSEAAARPMELLLISLGSCTASDVSSILKKKKVELNEFEVNLNAERQENHPKVFTKINIDYLFSGTDIKDKDVKRAIDLSLSKYCPISSMLSKTVNISYKFKINNI